VPFILAAHKHYSVDVFTALYVTPLVFDYLCKKVRDQDMHSADLAAHYGIRFRLANFEEDSELWRTVFLSYRQREYTVDIVDAPPDVQRVFQGSNDEVELYRGDVMLV
jgi:PAP2 superfamily C-terminal